MDGWKGTQDSKPQNCGHQQQDRFFHGRFKNPKIGPTGPFIRCPSGGTACRHAVWPKGTSPLGALSLKDLARGGQASHRGRLGGGGKTVLCRSATRASEGRGPAHPGRPWPPPQGRRETSAAPERTLAQSNGFIPSSLGRQVASLAPSQPSRCAWPYTFGDRGRVIGKRWGGHIYPWQRDAWQAGDVNTVGVRAGSLVTSAEGSDGFAATSAPCTRRLGGVPQHAVDRPTPRP